MGGADAEAGVGTGRASVGLSRRRDGAGGLGGLAADGTRQGLGEKGGARGGGPPKGSARLASAARRDGARAVTGGNVTLEGRRPKGGGGRVAVGTGPGRIPVGAGAGDFCVGDGSQAVGGAADAEGALGEDVGVDHGGAELAVAEELLDGSDVGPVLEEVGGEGVPQAVAGDAPGESGVPCGETHGALHRGLVEGMAEGASGVRLAPEPGGREDPLPGPVPAGARELAVEGAGEGRTGHTGGEIGAVDAAGDGELGSERSDGDLRQGDGPIAPALGALDPDLAALELEVLDPQPERLEQAEPAPVQEGGNEAVDAWKGVEQPADLIAREDEREVPRPPGADRGAEAFELAAGHVAVREEEGRQGLVLRGGGDPPAHGEVGEEGDDLGRAHLPGVAFPAEEDEAARPASAPFGVSEKKPVVPPDQRETDPALEGVGVET